MGTAPVASLSIDLDNLWTYQMVHGDPAWRRFGSYLDVVVPRLLDVLGERGLRLTAFLVGRDAESDTNAAMMRALADAGHEIGNHSYRHQPWLHRYGRDELHEELAAAEDAIEGATGRRPLGFRGPGYSLSPQVLDVLHERGYLYDCSTLPTVIGPLARAYYFRSARLDAAQRAERRHLFGGWQEGLRPLGAYRWRLSEGRSLVEIPVSTMPLARLPIHASYILYLRGVSERLARAWFTAALRLAERRDLELSILLHPLDLLGPGDADSLAFFPGMGLPLDTKVDTVRWLLDHLATERKVLTVGEHAELAAGRPLPEIDAATAGPRTREGRDG
jgi:peptidoglycan-N-acetylglucosamine deacetylase